MVLRTGFALRAVLAAGGIAGIWLSWAQQRQSLTIEKVSSGLWVVVGNGGNIAVTPTTEGVRVVDDKFAQDAPDVVAKVKTISDKQIRYVLNTHQHGDHTGGNEAMLASGAEVIITRNARANMVENNQPGLPRLTFSHEQEVYLGGKRVVTKYLGRGHTNGDAVISFSNERVLHTGDLFVSGAPFCDTVNGGSIKDWDSTIQKTLQLDFDTVIPGLGPVSKKADLQNWAQTLATLRTRFTSACASGADGAAGRMDWSGLGFTSNTMFERGLPGLCKELAQ